MKPDNNKADKLPMLDGTISNEPQSDKKTHNATRLSAMNFLSRREHSSLELQRKLKSREFPPDIIDKVLLDLGSEGLQSDSRYAENYIRMRSGKGYGLLKIRAELGERGISTELTDNSLESSDIDWYDLAVMARQKKYGSTIPEEWKEISKQSRFLQHRGFTSEQIREACKG